MNVGIRLLTTTVFICALPLFATSTHAFPDAGEKKSSPALSKIAGPDKELMDALHRLNPEKAEEALKAGANPNLVWCTGGFLPPCGPNDPGRSLFEYLTQYPYLKQPALIKVLMKYGGKPNERSLKEVLDMTASLVKSDPTRTKWEDYIPDKIAVIQTYVEEGAKFDRRRVKWTIDRCFNMKFKGCEPLMKQIAEVTGLPEVFGEVQGFYAEKDAQRFRREAEQWKQLEAQEAADRQQAIKDLPVAKTIGQKICKTMDGTLQSAQYVANGRPLYGATMNVKYFLTAFTENAVGQKIQLRIASIRMRQGGNLVNMDRLDGDTVLQNNSVVWDDPLLWRPC